METLELWWNLPTATRQSPNITDNDDVCVVNSCKARGCAGDCLDPADYRTVCAAAVRGWNQTTGGLAGQDETLLADVLHSLGFRLAGMPDNELTHILRCEYSIEVKCAKQLLGWLGWA